MAVDPLNIPALLQAVLWPALVVFGALVFRQPLSTLIDALSRGLTKLSFAGFTLELKSLSEVRAPLLDIDLRELGAGGPPESGPSDLLEQLHDQAKGDYVVIDLGDEESPRWLTSRLYLFGLVLSRVSRIKCFVFTMAERGVKGRFIGTASPDTVRWALARRYPAFEYAHSQAYAEVYRDFGVTPFLAREGAWSESRVKKLTQRFLAEIQTSGALALPFRNPEQAKDTIEIGNGVSEYAKWVNAARLERVLGSGLATSAIVVPSGKSLRSVSTEILRQSDRFVGIVGMEGTFRDLVDRQDVLASLARETLQRLDEAAK